MFKLIQLKQTLEDAGLTVDIREDGLIWTMEEHCYTWYECDEVPLIYDSEGDLPDYVQNSLEAVAEYFGTRQRLILAEDSVNELEYVINETISYHSGWMYQREEFVNKLKKAIKMWNKKYYDEL